MTNIFMPQQFHRRIVNSKIAIIIILVLAILIVGGVWWWTQKSTPEAPKTIGTPPVDETAGWQTYKNEKYGFEIKYPNDASYSVQDIGDDLLYYSNGHIQIKHVVIDSEYPSNRIHIEITTDKNILDNVRLDSIRDRIPLTEKSINNEIFTKFQRLGEGDGYGYLIQHDSKYFLLESVWGSQNEIFEKMMQTFKFTK